MTPSYSISVFQIWLATIAVALIVPGCASVSYQDGGVPNLPAVPEVIVQGEEELSVRVSTRELGVVLEEDAGSERALGVLGEHGLKLNRRVSDELLVFEVPHASTRGHIVSLARALRAAEPETFRAVGIVVWFPGSESPLIVTDDLVIQYEEKASADEIAELHETTGVEVLMANPFVENQFLVRVRSENLRDALEIANDLNGHPQVRYAHPDFHREVVERQVIPNDTYFGNQWHLDNTGQGGGTNDADIDAPEAWDFSLGDANRRPLVAVIDSGFDAAHPDLMANLWTNPGEVAGDGMDNDGNGLVDDVNGWDFAPCGTSPTAGCGDNDVTGGNHGTAVAGAVAAIDDNSLGVSGSCPNCQILLIRRSGGTTSEFQHALAFGYAQQSGAEIITNSWGYAIGTPATLNVVNAINTAATAGRGGLGSVVLFAMNNPNLNDCGATPDISSLANVIAVSRSTNQDQFDFSGFGDCMDVLSTSTTSFQPTPARGTLQGMTTDVQGAGGYNSGAGTACLSGNNPSTPPANAADYTYCFDGTSFATPVAAGIAGLVLSLDGTPTRLQIQQLMQDTADKTEHSLANYDPETGFSNDGVAALATHGFGRVNAFEAVRIAAPAADGGLGGVDVFVRDNVLDWGNTEQPSNVTFEPTRGFLGHWQSVDIKIDAPPFQTPPTSAADFAAFVDEQADVGVANRVYVRVRNRGWRDADDVEVKVLWTQFGTALPNFPNATIWTDFTDVATAVGDWNQLGVETQETLGYSGASVANTATDQAGIFRFDNFTPTFDAAKPNHFCLFAVVNSNQDPVTSTTLVPDVATPTDNNVTHRNVQVDLSSRDDDRSPSSFVVRNPFDEPIRTVLEVTAPRELQVSLGGDLVAGQPFSLKANESRVVEINVRPANKKWLRDVSGDINVTQFRLDEKRRTPLGGVVFEYRSRRELIQERPWLWLETYYETLFRKLPWNAQGETPR